jgi:hypothetical protein
VIGWSTRRCPHQGRKCQSARGDLADALGTARAPRIPRYGRGAGVGRGLPGGLGLAVGLGLGVGVAVGVEVGVEVGVAVAVAVAVGVDVGLAVGVGLGVPPPPPGAWIPTVMGDPVLKKPTVALALCGG